MENYLFLLIFFTQSTNDKMKVKRKQFHLTYKVVRQADYTV